LIQHKALTAARDRAGAAWEVAAAEVAAADVAAIDPAVFVRGA
jgi:hypothetical protein